MRKGNIKMKKALLAVLLAAITVGSGILPDWNREEVKTVYMPVSASKDKNTKEKKSVSGESVLEQAKTMYAQYDYDLSLIHI